MPDEDRAGSRPIPSLDTPAQGREAANRRAGPLGYPRGASGDAGSGAPGGDPKDQWMTFSQAVTSARAIVKSAMPPAASPPIDTRAAMVVGENDEKRFDLSYFELATLARQVENPSSSPAFLSLPKLSSSRTEDKLAEETLENFAHSAASPSNRSSVHAPASPIKSFKGGLFSGLSGVFSVLKKSPLSAAASPAASPPASASGAIRSLPSSASPTEPPASPSRSSSVISAPSALARPPPIPSPGPGAAISPSTAPPLHSRPPYLPLSPPPSEIPAPPSALQRPPLPVSLAASPSAASPLPPTVSSDSPQSPFPYRFNASRTPASPTGEPPAIEETASSTPPSWARARPPANPHAKPRAIEHRADSSSPPASRPGPILRPRADVSPREESSIRPREDISSGSPAIRAPPASPAARSSSASSPRAPPASPAARTMSASPEHFGAPLIRPKGLREAAESEVEKPDERSETPEETEMRAAPAFPGPKPKPPIRSSVKKAAAPPKAAKSAAPAPPPSLKRNSPARQKAGKKAKEPRFSESAGKAAPPSMAARKTSTPTSRFPAADRPPPAESTSASELEQAAQALAYAASAPALSTRRPMPVSSKRVFPTKASLAAHSASRAPLHSPPVMSESPSEPGADVEAHVVGRRTFPARKAVIPSYADLVKDRPVVESTPPIPLNSRTLNPHPSSEIKAPIYAPPPPPRVSPVQAASPARPPHSSVTRPPSTSEHMSSVPKPPPIPAPNSLSSATRATVSPPPARPSLASASMPASPSENKMPSSPPLSAPFPPAARMPPAPAPPAARMPPAPAPPAARMPPAPAPPAARMPPAPAPPAARMPLSPPLSAAAPSPSASPSPADSKSAPSKSAIADEIYVAYARENMRWLYEIYKIGGLTLDELREKVKERMNQDAAGPSGGASASASGNAAFQNLNKELTKKFKK